MREEQSRTRQYELMVIFSPDVSEEDLPGALDHVSGIISEAGGAITLINRESPWGRRRLSYPIRHNSRDVRDGFYVLIYADIDADKVIEVERDIKLTDTIMRYMVTQQVGQQMIPPSQIEAAAAAEDAEDAHAEEAAAAVAAAAAAAAGEQTAEAPADEAPAAEAAPAVETAPDADEAPVAEEAAPAESNEGATEEVAAETEA